MLQDHAVTLTFKVATKILRATRYLSMMIIYVKEIVESDFKQQSYGPDTILLLGLAVTLTFNVAA